MFRVKVRVRDGDNPPWHSVIVNNSYNEGASDCIGGNTLEFLCRNIIAMVIAVAPFMLKWLRNKLEAV